jgi:outer membrane protein TolC
VFTLERAVETAKRRNPSLRASRKGLQAAKKARKLSWAVLGPHLSGKVDLQLMGGDSTFDAAATGERGFGPDGVDRLCGQSSDYAECLGWMAQNGEYVGLMLNETMSGLGSLGDIMNSDYAKLSLNLYWEVFNPKSIVNIKRSEVSVKLSGSSVRDRSQDVQTQVTVAFYSVLAAEEALEITKRTAFLTRAHLRQARALVAAGKGTRLDILRWRARMANDRQQVLQAEVNVEKAKIGLNKLMGRPLRAPLSVEPPRSVEAQEIEPPRSVTDVASDHPRLRMVEHSVAAKKLDVRTAQATFMPTVSLSAGYNWQKYLPYEDASSNAGWLGSWGVMLSVNVPIFDSMTKIYDVQRRQLELSKARVELEDSRQALRQQVLRADLEVMTTYRKLGSARAQLELSEQAHQSAKNQYAAGTAKTTDVLDAQNSLVQARFNLLNARFSYFIALARRKRAVGSFR